MKIVVTYGVLCFGVFCVSRVVSVSDISCIGLLLSMFRIFFFFLNQEVITKSILEDLSLLGCYPVIGEVFRQVQSVLAEWLCRKRGCVGQVWLENRQIGCQAKWDGSERHWTWPWCDDWGRCTEVLTKIRLAACHYHSHNTQLILYFLQPDVGDIYTVCLCMAVLLGPLDPEDECTFCVKSVGSSHLQLRGQTDSSEILFETQISHVCSTSRRGHTCGPSSQAMFITKYLYFSIDVWCFLQ